MHGQISHLLQRKNGRISNSRTRMANALTSVHLSIHSPISVQATWHWRRGRWPIISANEQPPQRLPQRREPQWGSGSGGSSSPKYAGASAAGSIVCNRREGMFQSGNDTHTHTSTHKHTQAHTHKHTHTNVLTQLHSHYYTCTITTATTRSTAAPRAVAAALISASPGPDPAKHWKHATTSCQRPAAPFSSPRAAPAGLRALAYFVSVVWEWACKRACVWCA